MASSPSLANSYHLQIPLNIDFRLVRVSSLLPVARRLIPFPSLRPLPSFDHHHRHRQCSPQLLIACARPTQQEDFYSSEEAERRNSSHSCDEKTNADNSTSRQLSVDDAQGKTGGLQQDKFSSVRTVTFWACTAVAFGVILGMREGAGKASEFFAGFRTLASQYWKGTATKNYLMTTSRTPRSPSTPPQQHLDPGICLNKSISRQSLRLRSDLQSWVLPYGIAGAIIFRASIILLGTATLQRFEVVNLLLASILLLSSYKLFSSEEEETDLSNNFVVKTCQKFIPVTAEYDGGRFFTLQDSVWKATPLLLTVTVIELSDIAFAVDSIPAVFGVTRDPFIVFSSNFFAILGLRSLYTLISESMSELDYLQPAIGVVLGFIGCYHVSTEASLGFVATCLSAGVLLSLVKKDD